MILSFGEIESLSLKAVRGAGLSWGLAEEAGKAVRWLAEHGLDGPQALAGLLPHLDGADYADLRPGIGATQWRPGGEALCPLITGATLSDHAGVLPDRLTLGPVRSPLLLVPFVARAADQLHRPLAIDWSGARVVCGLTGIDAEGELAVSTARTVSVSRTDHLPRARPAAGRPDIDAAILEVLADFARRTYVPASEASRLTGAGAGTSDND